MRVVALDTRTPYTLNFDGADGGKNPGAPGQGEPDGAEGAVERNGDGDDRSIAGVAGVRHELAGRRWPTAAGRGPAGAVPARRDYRARYVDNDVPVGDWSDTVEVTAHP